MFVTLEGPEGAGKTTLSADLEARWQAEGRQVFRTREPGAGALGQAIRTLLLEGDSMPQLSELFLFLADRAHHVETLIRPALTRGEVVLCDRFIDSTVVYQGHARGLDLERLRDLNSWATGGLVPDATLLLDLNPEQGLGRLRERNRLDSESLAFHQRVREGFLHEAKLAPRRFRTIDASQPPDQVADQAWEAIRSLDP